MTVKTAFCLVCSDIVAVKCTVVPRFFELSVTKYFEKKIQGSEILGIGKIGMSIEKKRLIFLFQLSFDEFSYLQGGLVIYKELK